MSERYLIRALSFKVRVGRYVAREASRARRLDLPDASRLTQTKARTSRSAGLTVRASVRCATLSNRRAEVRRMPVIAHSRDVLTLEAMKGEVAWATALNLPWPPRPGFYLLDEAPRSRALMRSCRDH